LSEQEILEHYRNSKYYLASHFGPKTNCREDPGSCIDYGLVGYWSFDEGAGTTAYDASGKGNNGTIYGAKWTNGKFGQALSFDGRDDYVEIGELAPTYMTIGAWIKTTSTTYNLPIVAKLDKTNFRGFFLTINANWPGVIVGSIRFALYDTSNMDRCQTSNLNVNDGNWHYIVATYDGSYGKIYLDGTLVKSCSHTAGYTNPTTEPLLIGRHSKYSVDNTLYFNGLIDEVRIYNRALSEEEIRYLYNRGAPIAHWKFDEGKGNIAYDSSGNGNNGTLVNDPTWVQGKFGSALSFDGVDDYVNVGSIYSPYMSIEAWIYPRDLTKSYNAIIGRWQGVSGKYSYELSGRPDDSVALVISTNGTNIIECKSVTILQINNWYHIVGTFDGMNIKIYVNGKLENTCPVSGTIYNSGDSTLIGATRTGTGASAYNWNGLIDDVRIYNYARTPEQILQDYNAGLSTHFK
jgi:hypothetical protein